MDEQPKTEGCALCTAVDDGLGTVEPEYIYNTPLYESESFVILPCIGPLVMGHVMVVSKTHKPNIGKMSTDSIKEYEKLRKHICNSLDIYKSNLLESEHGANKHNSSGACIVHTHIHWIPKWGRDIDILGYSNVMCEVKRLLRLKEIDDPYIFVRGRSDIVRVYFADNAPSQAIRRSIAHKRGSQDWDWAVFPKYDLIRETVNYWV